jgi:geranylgeranyl diphosphate synthase type II
MPKYWWSRRTVCSRRESFVADVPVGGADWRVDLTPERSAIEAVLGRVGEDEVSNIPHEVAEAIRYSLHSPGKRLRGILLSFAYRAAGGRLDPSSLAAAVEIIHAYSLIHDDLPCMDNDDMRRGRPTTHKVYGIQTATAAGLVMIPLAIRCVLIGAKEMSLNAAATTAVVDRLMHAAGASGMIGGQWRDLEAEKETLTLEALEVVHRAKTGALIAAAAVIGGLAAGAPESAQRALEHYGADLGLAFQIVDDVLDVTSTTAQLGKTAGRDVALSKSTYPGLLGVPGATVLAQGLVQSSCQELEQLGLLIPELRYWASLVTARTH